MGSLGLVVCEHVEFVLIFCCLFCIEEKHILGIKYEQNRTTITTTTAVHFINIVTS